MTDPVARADPRTAGPAWVPVQVVDVDVLTGESTWVDAAQQPTGPVLALARVHSRALGVVELDLRSESLSELLPALRERFGAELAEHATRHGCDVRPDAAEEPPVCLARRARLLADAPTVSVVVATHDRPGPLAACLESVLAQEHPALEVVVVDNARSNDATERMLADDRWVSRGVRYVRDDVPGLGRAHNTGLANARGDVVAITDDDVLTDRSWTAALLEAFVEQRAGCVTGLILPMELRTREQSWVEQYGGFARGYRRRTFSLAEPPPDEPLFPFTAGRFGSGANMAFTRTALERMGGFDDALGAGTKAKGGDDLAAFAQTLLAGERLTYQPDAVIRHQHHAEYAALQRMARGYGVGLGAYVASVLARDPRLVGEVARRIPAGVRHLTSRNSDKNRNIRSDYPRELVRSERLGVLQGPFSYLASRRAVRRSLGRGAAR